jgi:Rieske Fe-S protein
MSEPPRPPAANGRRRFLKAAAEILGGLVAAVAAAPLVASALGPIFEKRREHFARVGPLDSFTIGRPANPTFEYRTDDAYLHQVVLHDIWVVRRSETDVSAFSTVCPHLGCHVYWEEQAKQFICPCHASIFSIDGRVLSGPAPRPLDTLAAKIEDGILFVKWERFQLGVPKKVSL